MAWTTPQTWPSLTDLTASEFNVHIRDNLNAMTTWATYSPTLTNWTLSDGTLDGYYIIANEIADVEIEYTVGASDTPSGNIQISLPSGATPASSLTTPTLGTATLRDSSGSATAHYHCVYSSGKCVIRNQGGTSLDDTNPWTWTTSDTVHCVLRYRIS